MKKKMRMRNIITKEVSLNDFADSLNGKIQRNENLSFNREKAEGYVLKFREDDEKKFEKEFYVKYPYFRFRGMPVDKETAFDIISKTDYKYYNNNKTESGRNIDLVNKWTRDKNTGIDFPHGWCHPDGTIGYNDHTTKYPDYVEVLKEVINIKLDFPFLEFMVAFSCWNCEAPYAYDEYKRIEFACGREKAEKYLFSQDYTDFDENIEILVYVHDKVIEVYFENFATVVYKDLVRKLQNKPDLKYVTYYYEVFWTDNEDIEQRVKEDGLGIDMNISRNRRYDEFKETMEKLYNQYLIKAGDIEKYREEHDLNGEEQSW